MMKTDPFVRLPTQLLEALMRSRLNGTQWRMIGWVIRHTYGWNRRTTVFSWYKIARHLSLDRGGVVRMGNALIRANLFFIENDTLGIREDPLSWDRAQLAYYPEDRSQQLQIPDANDELKPQNPSTENIGSDDECYPKRGQMSSDCRRPKDSSKESSKTFQKNRRERKSIRSDVRAFGSRAGRLPSAGAAKPVPGKYDRLSRN